MGEPLSVAALGNKNEPLIEHIMIGNKTPWAASGGRPGTTISFKHLVRSGVRSCSRAVRQAKPVDGGPDDELKDKIGETVVRCLAEKYPPPGKG